MALDALRCKECGSELSTRAKACPKCGAKAQRTSLLMMGCLSVVAGFVVLVMIGVILGDGSSISDTPATTSAPAAGTATDAQQSTNLTPAQRNAVRSAGAYLQMSGFSRQGLIDQLSSEYGDRFSVGDATVAVDNLNADWNAQAARSAATYLEMSGFSCQGLIDQLSSAHGDKYTLEQARYGATRAGIC